MGRLSVESAMPGMVLSKDALTFRKQLLLPSGTTLTEKNIETMKAWGVAEIETAGSEGPTLEDIEARLAGASHLQAAGAELDRRFANVREDAVMMEILTIAKKQLLEQA
jgi:hypothetical protein